MPLCVLLEQLQERGGLTYSRIDGTVVCRTSRAWCGVRALYELVVVFGQLQIRSSDGMRHTNARESFARMASRRSSSAGKRYETRIHSIDQLHDTPVS